MNLFLYSDDEKVMELLIQKGANINDVDKFGGTALHSAAANGKL